MHHSFLAARVFNTPLLITRARLDSLMVVLQPVFAGQPPTRASPPASVSAPQPEGGIAVIPIHGTLVQRTQGLSTLSGLTSYEAISRSLDSAMADPGVQGILLDMDTPGGEVAGLFDLADRIRVARSMKPIVAAVNDGAFSAGYALASAADEIVVTRTGGVGSIGVIALHIDQSARDAADGLVYTEITAGKHKADGSPHHPLNDSARASIQAEVDRLYGLFVTTVASFRGLSTEAVRATEAGVVFGADAVAAGLADRVGTPEDALVQLRQRIASFPSSVSTLEMPLMTTTSAAADTLTTTAPDLTALRAQAQAEALAIAELCQLAGQPALTASFLAEGLGMDTVRSRLLAARAAAAPEIASHVPSAPPAKDAENPLLRIAKARAALAKGA